MCCLVEQGPMHEGFTPGAAAASGSSTYIACLCLCLLEHAVTTLLVTALSYLALSRHASCCSALPTCF